MKKLGKLFINPEKVIKNTELINLRGGVYSCTVTVECFNGSISCTGDNSCKRDPIHGWVECDGNKTYC
jgi:hypothetical protein